MLAATPVQERSRGLQSGSPEGVVVVAVIVAALGVVPGVCETRVIGPL